MSLQPDAVQLFYTVAVHSRSELAIAPDEYAGFVMACLRMLSLSGAAGGAQQQAVPQVAQAANTPSTAATGAAAQTKQTAPTNAPTTSETPVLRPSTAQPSAAKPNTVAAVAAAANQHSADSDADSEPSYLEPEPEYFSGNDIDYGSEPVFNQADDAQFAQAPAAPVSDTIILPEPWAAFSAKLPLSGMAAQLARQSEWVAVSGRAMTLRLASKALAVGAHADRLRAVLTEYFGFVVQVHFEIGAAQGQSAHAVDLAAQAARQQAAEHSVTIDPFVQALMKDFGAHVVPGSIRPGHASL
jgi:DNA polymerase-3 subunit gamma/tau